MGLMQRAYETYCAMEKGYAGVYHESEKEPLAPVSHTLTSAALEITLDEQGRFVRAVAVAKEEPKTIIPVTEASAGRTGSSAVPHPLSDQLAYLSPCYPEKYGAYLQALHQWTESEHAHPKLLPILRYVEGGTILEDLQRFALIKLDEKGFPANEKLFVRWRVLSDGGIDECWKDATLFQSFNAYYAATQCREKAYCMISGREDILAIQHPKNVISSSANAKLISVNDKSGFTYRGRFLDDTQALTISYEVSQKAHSALHWLAANQGVSFSAGGRTFLCWDPRGVKLPKPNSPLLHSKGIKYKPSNYWKNLANTLKGWKDELPADTTAVIAAFDAATSGRLSLTYYNELQGSDFLERLHKWDSICCWYNGNFGVQSPSFNQIVNDAFGTPRGSQGDMQLKADDKVLCQQIQRLLSCRIDGERLPHDIVRGVVNHCANLQIYGASQRENLLFTACAIIRKYYFDKFKEEWKMALEPEKHDLSYQFGRLLAVLEKIERDTYERDEKREPNAMRLQMAYAQRPFHTGRLLWEQLKKVYYPQLKPSGRVFYDRLIGQIVEIVSQFPENQQNCPLGDTYLLGYCLQKNELYQSKTEQKETEE